MFFLRLLQLLVEFVLTYFYNFVVILSALVGHTGLLSEKMESLQRESFNIFKTSQGSNPFPLAYLPFSLLGPHLLEPLMFSI